MTYQLESDRSEYPDYQLVPLKGGRYATVFHGPPGTDVGDLHCDLEPYFEASAPGEGPFLINHSGWMPSEEQVKKLEAGGHIRLSVWRHPIPPLAVSVEPPVCACHEEAMQWDGESEGWLCARVNLSRPGADGVRDALDAADQARDDFKPDDDYRGMVEGG